MSTNDNPIEWGKTHCPYCGKPIAGEAEETEADRIEDEQGWQAADAYDAQFCWWVRSGYECTPSPDAVVITLRKEIDALRKELGR